MLYHQVELCRILLVVKLNQGVTPKSEISSHVISLSQLNLDIVCIILFPT